MRRIASSIPGLPYRGPGRAPGSRDAPREDRPTLIPLPPDDRLALWRDGRPRKSWRYVGVFCEELMLCVGDARVGPTRQSFWAVWDRRRSQLHQRTAWLRHDRVDLTPGRVAVCDADVKIDIRLTEEPGVETVCAAGPSYTWTRKQAGIRAVGTVILQGVRTSVDALACVDDSAGYHARVTSWWWSTGVGRSEDGRPVAWNLVEGINDPPRDSERSVWHNGIVTEPTPVSFGEDLSWVRNRNGLDLRFTAEAVRARDDNLLILRSRYRQPFGTFAGTLPGGVELARGYGVMERHVARW